MMMLAALLGLLSLPFVFFPVPVPVPIRPARPGTPRRPGR